MSKVKNQHYVPRFYLENFSGYGKKISVFDKVKRSSFGSNIANIACKNGFYDFNEMLLADKSDSQAVEKSLSDFESKVAPSLRKFIKHICEKKTIPEDLKFGIALFMTIQMLRTPLSRKSYVEAMEKGSQAVMNIMAKMKSSEIPRDGIKMKMNEDYIPIGHAETIFDMESLERFTDVFLSHTWIIGYSKTFKPFYTSDEPVIKIPHVKDKIFGSLSGIASEGIEIVLPLTPKHILILLEKTHFPEMERYKNRMIYLNAESIDYYNSHQVFQSYR